MLLRKHKMTNTAKLLGISLQIQNKISYLQQLRTGIKDFFPDLSNVLKKLDSLLAANLPYQSPTEIGYFNKNTILSVCQREWLISKQNEFFHLKKYLKKNGLLKSFKSARILGAGTCRLADHIGSQKGVSKVVCSDLSWIELYLRRLLIQGMSQKLPKFFHSELVFYKPNSKKLKLIQTTKPSKYLAPSSQNKCFFEFVVENAFHLKKLEEDSIWVPYLLDALGSEQAISLLVRLCEKLSDNQELLLITSLSNQKRNASLIEQVLLKSSMQIEYIDIVELPYSFSLLNGAYRRETWKTLIIKARKKSSYIKNSVVIQRCDYDNNVKFRIKKVRKRYFVSSLNGKFDLTPELFKIFIACEKKIFLNTLFNHLKDIFDEDSIYNGVGILAELGLIKLTPHGLEKES